MSGYGRLGCIGLMLLLGGCAGQPVTEKVTPYSVRERARFHQPRHWRLNGRVAVKTTDDSWNASIVWRHNHDADRVRLYGPLGQGAVNVVVSDSKVMINRGEGDEYYDARDQAAIAERLGVYVPLASLRFWILGIPHPEHAFEANWRGFQQQGWKVSYSAMQATEAGLLPAKIRIASAKIALKVIVDQWTLYDLSGSVGGAR